MIDHGNLINAQKDKQSQINTNTNIVNENLKIFDKERFKGLSDDKRKLVSGKIALFNNAADEFAKWIAEIHSSNPRYLDYTANLLMLSGTLDFMMSQEGTLSVDQVNQLSGLYASLENSCLKLIDSIGDTSEFGLSDEMVSKVMVILNQVMIDKEGIDGANLTKKWTLAQLLAESRAEAFDADNAEVSEYVGGGVNQRLHLKKGDKEFAFTESKKQSLSADVLRRASVFAPKAAEIIRKIESLNEGENSNAFSSAFKTAQKNFENYRTDKANEEDIQKIRAFFEKFEDSGISINEIMSDTALLKSFAEYGAEFSDARHSENSNRIAAIKPGRTLEKRNVAMTRTANLLGAVDILANSRTMQIEKDGDIISGVAMEWIQGYSDVNLQERKAEFGDQKEIIKQLSDMEVLDYICGNVDRHSGNIIFQVDEKTKKVTGVKGIDNDSSFGNLKGEEREQSGYMTRPEDMFIIRQKTAKRILSLSKEELSLSLRDLLESDEIDDAWIRVTKLQEHIKKSLSRQGAGDDSLCPGTTKILKEDDSFWDKTDLARLSNATSENSIYKTVAKSTALISTRDKIMIKEKVEEVVNTIDGKAAQRLATNKLPLNGQFTDKQRQAADSYKLSLDFVRRTAFESKLYKKLNIRDVTDMVYLGGEKLKDVLKNRYGFSYEYGNKESMENFETYFAIIAHNMSYELSMVYPQYDKNGNAELMVSDFRFKVEGEKAAKAKSREDTQKIARKTRKERFDNIRKNYNVDIQRFNEELKILTKEELIEKQSRELENKNKENVANLKYYEELKTNLDSKLHDVEVKNEQRVEEIRAKYQHEINTRYPVPAPDFVQLSDAQIAALKKPQRESYHAKVDAYNKRVMANEKRRKTLEQQMEVEIAKTRSMVDVEKEQVRKDFNVAEERIIGLKEDKDYLSIKNNLLKRDDVMEALLALRNERDESKIQQLKRNFLRVTAIALSQDKEHGDIIQGANESVIEGSSIFANRIILAEQVEDEETYQKLEKRLLAESEKNREFVPENDLVRTARMIPALFENEDIEFGIDDEIGEWAQEVSEKMAQSRENYYNFQRELASQLGFNLTGKIYALTDGPLPSYRDKEKIKAFHTKVEELQKKNKKLGLEDARKQVLREYREQIKKECETINKREVASDNKYSDKEYNKYGGVSHHYVLPGVKALKVEKESEGFLVAVNYGEDSRLMELRPSIPEKVTIDGEEVEFRRTYNYIIKAAYSALFADNGALIEDAQEIASDLDVLLANIQKENISGEDVLVRRIRPSLIRIFNKKTGNDQQAVEEADKIIDNMRKITKKNNGPLVTGNVSLSRMIAPLMDLQNNGTEKIDEQLKDDKSITDNEKAELITESIAEISGTILQLESIRDMDAEGKEVPMPDNNLANAEFISNIKNVFFNKNDSKLGIATGNEGGESDHYAANISVNADGFVYATEVAEKNENRFIQNAFTIKGKVGIFKGKLSKNNTSKGVVLSNDGIRYFHSKKNRRADVSNKSIAKSRIIKAYKH
ncbi:MAG: hypothetical protein K6E91_00670 [Butyrivibrio sp.]|nr:hypothetical protein [Butyrivibrio sp.]